MRPLSQLRLEISEEIPELVRQQKYPGQILWGFLILGAIAGLSYLIAAGGAPLPLVIVMSIALGLTHGVAGLYTHELLHGSILSFRNPFSKALMRVLAWFGFLIFGNSPEMWMTWHNRVHHFHANESNVDPDTFGLWSQFQELPMHDFVLKRAPGGRHWLAWFYLPLNFNNQALTVMWYFLWKGDQRLFAPASKPVAVFETLAMYAFWIVAGWKLGWPAMLWIFLVPLLIANLVVSSFILVQHLFCPLTKINDPFENTLGVKTPGWLDPITFYFSHHVEHHLFPELNHMKYPKLRRFLKTRYRERYRLMSHGKALRTLLTTPRVYRDAYTLLDPRSGRVVNVSGTGRARSSS